MQFVTFNGVTLHYRTVGDIRRRPLIAFANSLGTDFRLWEQVVAYLGGAFSALLYDKRGHGLSSVGETPYRIADHAADLGALIDHVGARSAIACGISVGGQIALSLAASRPDLIRGLILCNTGHKIGDATLWNTRVAAIETGGIRSVADAILDRWFAPDFAMAEPALYAGCRAMLTRQPVNGYIATCAAVRDCDLTAEAGRIDVPTLCVVGAHDRSTTPALVESLAKLIPGAEFQTIAGAGHLPPIERPAALAKIIRAFAAGTETESLSHAAR